MKTFSLNDEVSVQKAQACFSHDGSEIFYKNLFHFIDHILIPSIKKNMNWSECRWSKLRISDHNNNTDAAAFHRDLVCYADYDDLPIYTCLCYLDEGNMEIIKGSHLYHHSHQFLKNWGKRQQVPMSAGDVLVFRSNTLHRGLFQHKHSHRRLIQLFECFTNTPDYSFYFPKILFVPARSSHGDTYKSWTVSSIFSPIINYIAFMNASSGYNPKKVQQWLAIHYPDSYLISSDAEQERWDHDGEKETQPTNLYIYPEFQPHRVDLKEEHHKILKRMQYVQPLTFYACLLLVPVLLLMIFLVVIMIVLATKKKSQKNKNKSILRRLINNARV